MCETCYFKQLANTRLGTGRHWVVIKAKLESQNYLCAYTGEKLILGVNTSLDHILSEKLHPELRHDPNNIEWVTRHVNTMKREFSPSDFLTYLRGIIRYRTSSESSDE